MSTSSGIVNTLVRTSLLQKLLFYFFTWHTIFIQSVLADDTPKDHSRGSFILFFGHTMWLALKHNTKNNVAENGQLYVTIHYDFDEATQHNNGSLVDPELLPLVRELVPRSLRENTTPIHVGCYGNQVVGWQMGQKICNVKGPKCSFY